MTSTIDNSSFIETDQVIPSSLLSPNIGNYYIGKGILSMKLLGESVYTDMGNVPEFTFESKVTSLDHFSSRQGVRFKDFVAVTEVAATITMQLEEFTARNMAFALLGVPNLIAASPGGDYEEIQILSSPIIYGSLQFQGSNLIGPVYTLQFPLVKLSPSKALSLIGNEWGNIELEGDVLYDSNVNPNTGVPYGFGTATVSQPVNPPGQNFF